MAYVRVRTVCSRAGFPRTVRDARVFDGEPATASRLTHQCLSLPFACRWENCRRHVLFGCHTHLHFINRCRVIETCFNPQLAGGRHEPEDGLVLNARKSFAVLIRYDLA